MQESNQLEKSYDQILTEALQDENIEKIESMLKALVNNEARREFLHHCISGVRVRLGDNAIKTEEDSTSFLSKLEELLRFYTFEAKGV